MSLTETPILTERCDPQGVTLASHLVNQISTLGVDRESKRTPNPPIPYSIVAFSLSSYHTMVETTNEGNAESVELPFSEEQLKESMRIFNENKAIKGITLSFYTGVNGEVGEFLASHTSDVGSFRDHLNNRIKGDKKLIIFGSDEHNGTYYFSLRCRGT